MEAKNPLYPGYYPGDPIQRRPMGGSIIEPREYDMDIFAGEIDNIEMTILGVPKIIVENIEADIKFNFKAAVYSKGSTTEELSVHGEEEIEELPGAIGAGISLNPADWRKDPLGQAKKTVWGWVKTTWDIDELSSRARGEMWRSLAGLTETEDKEYKPARGLAQAQATVGEEALLRGKAYGVFEVKKFPANPLRLAKSGILDGDGNDLGNAFGEAIVDFQQSAASSFFRDSTHSALLENGVKAVVGDMKEQIRTLRSAGVQDVPAELESFLARADFVRNIGKTDKLAESIEKAVSRTRLEKATSADGKGVTPQTALADALKDLRVHIDGGTNSKGDQITEILGSNGYIAQTRAKLSGTELAAFDQLIKPYEGLLEDLRRLNLQELPKNSLAAKELARRIHSIRNPKLRSGGITRGDVFRTSVERRYLQALEKELIRDPKGIFASGYAGDLTRKVRLYLPQQEATRHWHMLDELVGNLENQNLIHAYLWQQVVIYRLSGWTPAYYLGNFMKKMHFFGLVVDNDSIDYTFKNPLYRAANAIVKNGRIFENRFSIKIETPGGRMITVKRIAGGEHFSAVKELTNLLGKGILDERDLRAILIDTQKVAGFNKMADPQKLKVMKDALRALGKGAEIVDSIPDEVLLDAAKLSKWLAANKDRLGIDLEQAGLLAGFITSLQKYNLDLGKIVEITRKYAGVLQKITRVLNKIQKVILNSIVGKVIGKFINIKEAIAHFLAGAIITALGVATEGVGFVTAAFEFALKWVIKKGLDILTGAAKLVIGADLDQLDLILEKSAGTLLKITGLVIAVPTLLGIVVLLGAMAIVASFSPINPAKGIGGEISDVDPITGGAGAGVAQLDPITPGGCPLQGGALTTPSYGFITTGFYVVMTPTSGGWDRTGHGTDNYWTAVGGTSCRYNMPAAYMYSLAPNGPLETGSMCYAGASRRNEHYGKAADFVAANMGVFAPELGGINADNPWRIVGTPNSSAGGGVILQGSGDADYRLLILHINRAAGIVNGMNVAPGIHLGNMWNGWPGGGNVHIHVELIINGVPVRPESYLCN